MQNFIYLDRVGNEYLKLDGMVQINNEYYKELSEDELFQLCCDNGLFINDGDLLVFKNKLYLGTVLEINT